MNKGLAYLKSLKRINHSSVVRKLQDCSLKNGGCDMCPNLQQCQDIHDKMFNDHATFIAVVKGGE